MLSGITVFTFSGNRLTADGKCPMQVVISFIFKGKFTSGNEDFYKKFEWQHMKGR